MKKELPAPFDADLCEKLDALLVRYGVDDRVTHAVVYQIAHLVAEHKLPT